MSDLYNDPKLGALIAENLLINRLQVEIEKALDRTGVTQAELAKLLGVSSARVSQILAGDGSNLRARTVARIAHALGVEAVVHFRAIARDYECKSDWRVWQAVTFEDDGSTQDVKAQSFQGARVSNENAPWNVQAEPRGSLPLSGGKAKAFAKTLRPAA